MKKYLIAGAVIFIGAFWLAWFLKPVPPVPEPEVKIVKVDRTIAVKDTSGSAKPVVKKIFTTVTNLDTVYVSKDAGLNKFNISPLNPVKVLGDRVYYTYFNPRTSGYEQDVFNIRRNFYWGVYFDLGYDKSFLHTSGGYAGLRLRMDYKKFSFFSAIEVMPWREDVAFKVGVSYKIR